jgi:pyruvate dehydrogenase E1 component alpha subunit
MTMDTEHLFELYRQMLRIRRFEEEAARAYAQSHAGGFLHLYIGQEAIAVGASSAMRDEDYVFQTYRDHGIALARGMAPGAAMAELFGKDTGCSRGMGGSMHFFDPEHGFYGGWGIVGGHLALAAGTAFKSRYRGDDSVTVCFFGEGATNIGGFHEAFSLAGLWKLPVVFICENNRYAMGTPLERTSPLTDLTLKAQGYGMAADRFEGSDVSLVEQRVAVALERARSGEGPTFIEVDTYRFRGHSMSDPAKYRTREELEERKKEDPLAVTRAQLEETGAEVARFDAIEEAVEREVAAAVEFAKDSPPAREETMFETVLVKGDA